MKKITVRSLMALMLISLMACMGGRKKQTEQDRPLITVTIEPLRYFTEAIAGDRFRVVSMVPTGSSPESYDPTPQQLIDLADSRAYFRIGYIGFEQTWMEKLSDNAPHLQVFDTSKGIDLIFEEGGHGHDAHGAHDVHAGEHAAEDAHAHHHVGGVEPHVWTSFENARIIGGNILKALCQLDPEGRESYVRNYNEFFEMVSQLDTLACGLLSRPEAQHAFMIYHPALSYLARDFGLRQIPIEAGGKEPSPSQLKELIARCMADSVKTIFIQPEFDKRNAQLVAEQTGAKLVDINPLSYDWCQEIMHVVRVLASSHENFTE